MSDQSYFFNPTEDRTALTGVGFQGPRLPTAVRTSLSVSAADAGMTVYDTTLRQLFVWNGTVWKEIKRKLFNPADYGASYSWWAARLESYTNGQDVSTWTDRGSGTLTVSAPAGQEPTFHTAVDPVSPNGYPFIRWATGDRFLNTTSPLISPDWTVAIVCRPTAITGTTSIIGSSSFSGSASVRYRSNSGGQLVVYTGITSVANGPKPIIPVGWQVIVTTIQGNQQLLFFKSGLSAAPSPNNFFEEGYVAAGAYTIPAGLFALGANPFTGEIAEAVLWPSAINLAGQRSIGKSLAAQYGISY